MTITKPIAFICDDEPDVRRVMELSLVAEGFEVHTLPTLKGLEEELALRKPNVLILDIMLPGGPMDGMDMCRHLKDGGRFPKLKIMLCSAITRGTKLKEDEFRQTTGADDVMFKPFEPSEFRRRVKGLVS